MERLLDTVAAAQRLTARGVKRTAATLRKLRCVGGGPVYRTLTPSRTTPSPIWTPGSRSGCLCRRAVARKPLRV
jgi:hypothetical protein